MLRVVLDTNIILSSVSPYSPYRMILDQLDQFAYEICVSTEILLEYEEKLSEIFSPEVAELALNVLTINPNVLYISPKFKLQMIYPDMDDNKFVDCAFAGNAHYLVTNDRDYNTLKNIDFPKINLLKIEQFMAVLATI